VAESAEEAESAEQLHWARTLNCGEEESHSLRGSAFSAVKTFLEFVRSLCGRDGASSSLLCSYVCQRDYFFEMGRID
jgi:hypothetical protein